MNPQELKRNLAQFTGTESYHSWSVIFPHYVLSDGAKYLAEEAGAYWLMDMIGSHLPMHTDTFGVAKLVVTNDRAVFTLDDGNGNVICRQEIPFTDFPLPEIRLYVQRQDRLWVLFLPSEY